jgi:opacity protein-like surface antigen
MRHLSALIILIAAAGAARAQEPERPEILTEPAGGWMPEKWKPDTLFGVRTGFLMATDAEEAVPFLGIGARFPLADMGAFEITADLWQDEFLGGDAEATHAPVMFSGLLYFPLEIPTTTPYILAGVGMHFLSISYSGGLDGAESEDDAEFAFHGGGGLEITVGSMLKIHMDVRWILLDPDPDVDALRDEEMDTVQFTFAIDLRF